MRRVIAVLGVLAVLGCAEKKQPEIAAIDLSDRLSPGCYTVDLFDTHTIENPGPDVPEDAQAFLGVWKNGAWNGHWCHDLFITAVRADGTVELLDAYGPWHEREIEATVFKRKGRIEDGVLKFRTRGGTHVEYRLAGRYLVGQRAGTMGDMEVTLSRAQDEMVLVAMGPAVPLPPRKPVRPT